MRLAVWLSGNGWARENAPPSPLRLPNAYVALDDKVARKETRKLFHDLGLLNTQTLIVSMIRAGVLSVEEADHMKAVWEKEHRFRLKIGSFADLLSEESV